MQYFRDTVALEGDAFVIPVARELRVLLAKRRQAACPLNSSLFLQFQPFEARRTALRLRGEGLQWVDLRQLWPGEAAVRFGFTAGAGFLARQ